MPRKLRVAAVRIETPTLSVPRINAGP